MLVVLLLLNVMGYYGLFLGLKYKNTVRVMERINAAGYNPSEAMTLKIPLSIPYYGDTDFERVDGEIEHQGEFFRLVKQKLEKDTLYVVCIKDSNAKHIHKALTDYVKTFSDQSSDQSNNKAFRSIIKDYFPAYFSLEWAAGGWAEMLGYKDQERFFSGPCMPFPAPPPKA